MYSLLEKALLREGYTERLSYSSAGENIRFRFAGWRNKQGQEVVLYQEFDVRTSQVLQEYIFYPGAAPDRTSQLEHFREWINNKQEIN